ILSTNHGEAIVFVNSESDPMQWSGIVRVYPELAFFGRGSIRTDQDVPSLRLISEVHLAAPRSGHFVPKLEIQPADDGVDRIRYHRLAAGNPVADAGVKRVQIVDRISRSRIQDRRIRARVRGQKERTPEIARLIAPVSPDVAPLPNVSRLLCIGQILYHD